ncbi:MAG: hypothetical protein ACJ763_03740 [Bdellovibrionia bacterium]
MLFNDIRQQTNSNIALTTGGLSLMVGSLLLSLSAFSVYRLNQTQDITINTASWNWMSEVRLRLDAGTEAMGPLLSEAILPEYVAPAVQAPARPRVKAKSKWIAKAGSIIRRAKPPRHEPDAKAIVLAKKAETKAQPVEAPSQASESELNTFQGLHQQLRGHFMLAMTTQPQMAEVLVAQMGPQAAKPVMDVAPATALTEAPAAVEVTPEPIVSHRHLHKKKAPRRKVIQDLPSLPSVNDETIVAHADVLEPQTPAPASVPSVTTQDTVAEAQSLDADTNSYSIAKQSFESAAQDQIQSTQAAPSDDYSPQADVSTDAQKDVKKESASQAESTSSGKILVASGSQTVWVSPAAAASDQKGTAPVTTQSRAPAPTVATPSKPSDKEDSTLLATVDTQRVQNVVRAQPTKDTADEYSVDALNTQSVAVSNDASILTEAFDWVSTVSGGSKSYVSKEAGSQNSGWVLAKAADHWPTLARRSAVGIPLISKNTSKLLSTLAGATLESEAGIVFGKLPSGWTVRLSGRSERPIFLNARNQTISPSTLEGERYFAFLNVAPGAHLAYLANRSGVEEGAVGLAVVGGAATFADLTTLRKSTVTGKILDGSDAQTRAMAGATVRVLGALSTHTESSRNGSFRIENVLTVGDYPIYIETDSNGGYTHRYQLAPSKLQKVLLYRLSPSAIQTWTSQLEGAISPDSGIMIAAVPSIAATPGTRGRLTPVVQSLAANPTLRPEVYTLSSGGQMQVGQALDAQNTRFVSVQVPEGPAIAKVVDSEKPADKNLVWSEMLMVSPAVVNIVGPF